jgi:hypothetical protein
VTRGLAGIKFSGSLKISGEKKQTINISKDIKIIPGKSLYE